MEIAFFPYQKILTWGCRRKCQIAIPVASMCTVLQESQGLEPEEDTGIGQKLQEVVQ